MSDLRNISQWRTPSLRTKLAVLRRNKREVADTDYHAMYDEEIAIVEQELNARGFSTTGVNDK